MQITKSTDGDWNLQLTISHSNGYQHKAADCLSRLVKLPNNTITIVMMLTATNSDGPAFNTRSRTSQQQQTTKDTRPPNTPSITNHVTSDSTTVETTQDITPKPLTTERHEALL